jgi:hypothetical protein
MTTFDDLCARYELTAEWTSAEGFHVDADGWEHQLFRFRWSIAGEDIGSNIPYRQGVGIDDEPSGERLLAAILNDAGCAMPYYGTPFDDAWLEWADDLGYPMENGARAKEAREAYRACAAWRDLLIERLGEDAARELIDAAQEL